MELQKNAHHVFRLMYHFVWIPKYRYKFFSEPYREEMETIFHKIGFDYDIDIVEVEILEDHIQHGRKKRAENITKPSDAGDKKYFSERIIQNVSRDQKAMFLGR